MKKSIVIIGTGLAGYQLAKEFRKINPDAALTLISADAGNFYSKPQLSTALTNKKNAQALVTYSAESMAEQLNATIRTHVVATKIDKDNKQVHAGNERFSYDYLVLACGADVVKPPLEGDGKEDVLSINHLYHYEMFEELIKKKKRIAILGAGLIGCEFANDLTNAGYLVDVIAPAQAPLDFLVPTEIGNLLRADLEKNGVTWHLPCVAKTVTKQGEGYRLDLSNGQSLETDFVLSAIGLIPHISLAQTASILTQRGIVVNKFLETSTSDIFALGDCAEVEGHVLPFITPLLLCSRALAKTLSGTRTAVDYPAMPVVVKTPAHPLVICPPPKNMAGTWEIENENNNVKALFRNTSGQLFGFILTNNAVKQRGELVKQIPALF